MVDFYTQAAQSSNITNASLCMSQATLQMYPRMLFPFSLYYPKNISHSTLKNGFSDSNLTLLASLQHFEMFPKPISVWK